MILLYDIASGESRRYKTHWLATRQAKRWLARGAGAMFLVENQYGDLLLSEVREDGGRGKFRWRKVSQDEAAKIINKDKISSSSPEPA